MKLGEKGFNVDELLKNAVPPETWKAHVVDNLMKFWDKPEITDMTNGLFPTYIMNNGHVLPENPDEWSEEFKKAVKSEDTAGLV